MEHPQQKKTRFLDILGVLGFQSFIFPGVSGARKGTFA